MLAGVIDLDYQRENGLWLPSGGKEESVWYTKAPLGVSSAQYHAQ